MSIDVSGGAGGTHAELDDLDAGSRVLDATAVELLGCAARGMATGANPSVAAAVVVVATRSPHLAAAAALAAVQVERHAVHLAGPAGAGGEAAALELLALTVRAVVAAYREADRVAAAAIRAAQDTVMDAMGVAAPVLLLGLGSVALLLAVPPMGRGATPSELAGLLDEVAYRMPGVVDVVAGGFDGLLRGLAAHPACAVVLVAAATRAGIPWPPQDERQAIAVLVQVGSIIDALDEGRVHSWVTETALPAGADLSAHAPTGVAGLLTDAVDLGDPGSPGRVRVTRVPQPDGSSAWVVQVPGTQAWSPDPGDDPFDLTTDVVAMSGGATLAAAGASIALGQAMTAAGRGGEAGRDDPVLLAGHSQGGIVAAALASDPDFRAAHPRLQVVTAGSPIAHFPIPASVPVLSLEHLQDPVPRLDGSSNPDRPSWTTVRADLREREAPTSALASHGSSPYLTTAQQVDSFIATHQSVSLDAWAAGAAPFLGGDRRADVTDYRVQRVPTRPLRPTRQVGARW